jgi:hypothetical protein
MEINYTKLNHEQKAYVTDRAEWITWIYRRINGKRTAFVIVNAENFKDLCEMGEVFLLDEL